MEGKRIVSCDCSHALKSNELPCFPSFEKGRQAKVMGIIVVII